MWGVIKSAASWLFSSGGSSVVTKSIALASEYIEDIDKRNDLIAKIVISKMELDSKPTIPIVDAIHKLGRMLMIMTVVIFYMYCKLNDIELELMELVALISGPGIYTIMKGRGQ